MDDELFELCKEVYKRTGWGNKPDETESFYVGTDETGYKRRFIRGVPRISNTYPYYTSDFVLDKMPKETRYGTPNLIRYADHWEACYTVAIGTLWSQELKSHAADTPLKALLKLVIALNDVGEL